MSRKGPNVRLKPVMLEKPERPVKDDVVLQTPRRRITDVQGIDFHMQIGYKVVVLVIAVLTSAVASLFQLLERCIRLIG